MNIENKPSSAAERFFKVLEFNRPMVWDDSIGWSDLSTKTKHLLPEILNEANSDSPDACYVLGLIYYKQLLLGVPQSDDLKPLESLNEAEFWFVRAKALGYNVETDLMMVRTEISSIRKNFHQ